MSEVLHAAPLAAVVRSVLGDAAFLFCDDVPPDTAALEGPLAEATITFKAPRDGRLTLRLPWQVAVEAAANLLGTEADDPQVEENALAAAGELLNIISNCALGAWFGPGTSWTLGVPATRAHRGQLPSPSPEGALVAFVIDDRRIELEAIETRPP